MACAAPSSMRIASGSSLGGATGRSDRADAVQLGTRPAGQAGANGVTAPC
jgi:hypothetical protein